jgi:hypothetical protein
VPFHEEQGKPLAKLLNGPEWIPSLVAHALKLLPELAWRDVN